MRSLRTGLAIAPDVAGRAPLVAAAAGTVAIAAMLAGGDLRAPLVAAGWATAATALAVTALGIIAAHRPVAPTAVLVGGRWTAAALLGLAGFFVAVGVGGLLGIAEDSAGLLGRLPVVSMAFGLLSMPVALAVFAVAVARVAVLPRTIVIALASAAPMLPLMMIGGGLAEGTAESVAIIAAVGAFATAWIVAGATQAATARRTVPAGRAN